MEILTEAQKVSISLINVMAQFHVELRLPLSCRDSRCHDNQSACDSQSDENPRPTSGPMMSPFCSQ